VRWRATSLDYAWAVAVVAGVTLAASAARAMLHLPDVELVFLLGITVVAVTSTRGPSILAAVLSVAAYDFFFVAPAHSLDVEDARYFLTFAMMLGIGIVMSNLTVRWREHEQAAAAREQRTSALYDASHGLAAALDGPAVAAVCTAVAADVIGAAVVLLERGADEALSPLAASPAGATLSESDLEVARWTSIQGSPAGGGAGPFADVPVACFPARAAVEVRAVLAVRLPTGGRLRSDQREFLEALCRQGALALDRVHLAAEVRAAALRAETEQLRSALLSAVSHDLRTPLATITGAATTLRDGGVLEEGTRRELVEAICDEAERLERLVRNLLDMTRLESGAVQLKRDWVPVEEIVLGALARLERYLGGRRVATDGLAQLPLVYVDPVLLEQLFVNLIENATKYTPDGTAIEIAGRSVDDSVTVEVADRGAGIPPGMEEQVFERFRRGVTGVPGVGLGLAIARAVARAHEGTLTAANRAGGGAVFVLSLPRPDRPAASAEAIA